MKREIEPRLRSLLTDLEDPRVILLEGARQVGKTYLAEHVLQELPVQVHSFDLEKNSSFRRALNSTTDFSDFQALLIDQYGVREGAILFIDEAQESKKLAQYIRSFKEDWPEIKTILSGSSMNRLFDDSTRIPVGRIVSICLYGFSFSEFVEYVHSPELADFIRSAPEEIPASRHAMLLELYDDYLKVGGYPEAVAAYAAGKDHIAVTDEIMALMEEDFARKESYQPELFRTIIGGISNNLGSLSKLTQFKSTKYFAQKALEAMRRWHIVVEVAASTLDPLHSDCLPKRYLHDPGVANRRRSLAAPSISILETLEPHLRTPLGGLFENALLLNLLSGRSASYSVNAWKKGNSNSIEVDFILEYPDHTHKLPVECKAALTLKKKHYKNIIHYLNLTNQHTGAVVSAAPLERIHNKELSIVNIPIYLALPENIFSYCR